MSSRKIPEVIFTAKALNGYIVFDNMEELSMYALEHEQEELMVHIIPAAKVSPKLKMYKYYHKVILNCAMIGYTHAGYPNLDLVSTDYLLRAELAKSFVEKPGGEYQPIMLDKRNMTKARLHKYLEDCIFFIETQLQVIVPDSEAYKSGGDTGNRNFKTIKNK